MYAYIFKNIRLIDYLIHPIVEPHRFAHFLKRPMNNYKGFRPKEKQRVRFSVWDGNNAPDRFEEWTGEVIDKRRTGVLMEYIIRRDLDQETVKLTRGYISKIIDKAA